MIFCIAKQFFVFLSALFSQYSIVSDDSPGKFYLLCLPVGKTIPENKRVLSRILHTYPQRNLSLLEKRTKTTEMNCKITFSTLELLAPIGATANKISYISPVENFQSWENEGVLAY